MTGFSYVFEKFHVFVELSYVLLQLKKFHVFVELSHVFLHLTKFHVF